MTLVIFLAALIGGMLIGLPICFALLFSGVCMMLYLNGFNAQILSQNLFSGADSFSMMAVPFFIMAGEFMNRGGITKRIVNAANAIIGHVRGGLGYVAIMAILLFASMIGSAVASTAFLGAILIPMMVRAGYKRDTCTGLIARKYFIADHAAVCTNDYLWRAGRCFRYKIIYGWYCTGCIFIRCFVCIMVLYCEKRQPRKSRETVCKTGCKSIA